MPKKSTPSLPSTTKQKRAPPERFSPIPVEPVTPPPGPGHLPPVGRETAHEHRGFLLWAMMSPSRRSNRAVSRAIGVGEVTIRRWAAKNAWTKRAAGESADRLAWQEYLGRYPGMFGIAGISVIQDSMDFPGPMTPLAILRSHLGSSSDARAYPVDSAARATLEGVAELSREVMGDQLHDPAPEHDPSEPGEVDLLDDSELIEDARVGGSPVEGKGGVGGGRGPSPGGSSSPHPSTSTQAPQQGAPTPGPTPRSGSVAPGAPTPKPVAPGAIPGSASAAPPPAPPNPAGAAPSAEDQNDPVARRARVERFRRQIVTGALGAYARDLAADKVKVSTRDMALLLEIEQGMQEKLVDTGSRGPTESVRVRTAREQGEDLLEALSSDLAEQATILDALKQKRSQDVAHLRMEMERRAVSAPALANREEGQDQG